jgi:hypothetical protein
MSRTSRPWFFLIVAALASCKGSGDGGHSAAKPAARDAGPEITKGRFANVRKSGARGMAIIDDTPPPLTDEMRGHLSIDGDDDEVADRGGGGAKKKRFGQSPLYVDGTPVAVVAYGELPAWLPDHPVKLGDGRTAVRFVFGEYLAALGIDLARVQAVHLYGGRGRIAILRGDELRRVKKQLLFSFTEGDAGKMRMHWDGKLDVSDTIDKVQAVAVYIEKKPPAWSTAKWGLVDEHDTKIDGIPFVQNPLKGGVRIYLDGRIAHLLKRNRTFDRGTEPHRFVDGVPHFRLFDYLEEEKLDTGEVVAIELLDKNAVAARLEGKALAAERDTIEMSAPASIGGRVLVHLGSGPTARDVQVTAINLYTAPRATTRYRRK